MRRNKDRLIKQAAKLTLYEDELLLVLVVIVLAVDSEALTNDGNGGDETRTAWHVTMRNGRKSKLDREGMEGFW